MLPNIVCSNSEANPPPFDDFSGNEMVDTVTSGKPKGRDLSAHLASGNSLSMTPKINDPGSTFSPHLPPVFEEPSSFFSDVAAVDPLPAIEGLQILGEAFPGQELQACSYSINGTTSCNFEWVQYLEDGSVHYIAGAKQPNYPVTVDDVDSYLAIEVQPHCGDARGFPQRYVLQSFVHYLCLWLFPNLKTKFGCQLH